MSKNKIMAAFLTLTSALCFSTYAIAGIGIHWGNDFSMKMDDVVGERLVFDSLKLSFSNAPAEILIGKDLPITITRTNWERKPFNLGAKFYIDIIPFIDAIELSSNYGVWEYKGSIKYPTSLTYGTISNPIDSVKYDSIPITLDRFNMGYLGLKNTPYMKLNFDLTIRKYIVRFPKPLKTLNIYGGGGVSLIFATPVLSSKLVEDALGSKLSTTLTPDALSKNLLGNDQIMKAVLDEITAQFMTPHFGAHIDLGLMIKIPVLPFGIYVDGKYMIPFADLDKSVAVGGRGFLLNTGISLTL